MGRPVDAVGSWRKAISLVERQPPNDGEFLSYVAGCHARLGGIAGLEGSGLSDGEGVKELDEAMKILHRAVDAGYRNVTWMSRDPDLDPLRARPDFQLLMRDLAMPADPFSHSP